MSRGNERHRNSAADIDTITPVVSLRGNCRVKISHDDVVAQRRDDACAMHGRYPRQGTDIEVVIVTVRHQYDVDRWQLRKRNAWIVDPFRPGQSKRRRALRPHGIEQDVSTGGLNQKTGMADVGNPPSHTFDTRGWVIGIRRWRPGRPLRPGTTPAALDEPAQQVTAASRRRPVRIEEPHAIEVI